jgi:hypothetical protein
MKTAYDMIRDKGSDIVSVPVGTLVIEALTCT